MTIEEVMSELETAGSPAIKKVFLNHGAREPFFGVKVADLKLILKKAKKDQALAMELYRTGNSDAMYLAGLMADGKKMTKHEINSWAQSAYWYMISEYTVPWVASESDFGTELADEWIENAEENIAAAGWSTWSCVISVVPNENLPIERIRLLLNKVKTNIHSSPNRVRYCMNNFVISVGSYIGELSEEAIHIANHIGKVNVDMGGSACKVPLAAEYIEKSKAHGSLNKKRKLVKC